MTGNLPVIIGGGTRTVTADHTILAVPLPILQQHVDLTPPAPFTDASSAYTRDLADRHLAQIDTVWPGTRAAWNGRATLSAWHLNPYSYGAYSYWPVGYLTGYAGYEGTAQGNLHFAGEHCSYDYQGYMNGGAVEGARAAAEVLTAIGA
ncbi:MULTISPECIES: FAD-dependent oxidoreductase [Kitasatospora]|nr:MULTISPECIES: FAD-dependent oxidoreductase [Kitasatospora]